MAHPNVKLVVYLQYFGDKILDKPNALNIVRRDLVTLGIPHPKGTNVEFPARNAVQGYWLSHTGGILHKNLMVRIRENQPDRAALDEMSLSSLTLYEIFDDLSDEQPIVTPPSDSITFPPPRPSTSPHKRHHHHHHHESSSYTPQWQHKSASRQPYSSSSPVARKRRLSDAFSQHEFDSGSYRSGNGFGNRGSPSNRHPRVKIEEDCSSTSSIPMFPPASYQSRFAHPSEMPLGFEEPLTASGGLLERLVQNNPPHLEAQQALDAVNHALAVAKAKLMAAEAKSTRSHAISPHTSTSTSTSTSASTSTAVKSSPSTVHISASSANASTSGVRDQCRDWASAMKTKLADERAKREDLERQLDSLQRELYYAQRDQAPELTAQLRDGDQRLSDLTGRYGEEVKRRKDSESRWREMEGRANEAESRWREAEGRMREAEGRMREAEGRTREAERVVDDVRRECKEPFVVPALLEAFLEIGKMGEWAAGGGGVFGR